MEEVILLFRENLLFSKILRNQKKLWQLSYFYIAIGIWDFTNTNAGSDSAIKNKLSFYLCKY